MSKRFILFSSKNILKGVFDSTVIEFLRAIKQVSPEWSLSLIIFLKSQLSADEKVIFMKKKQILQRVLDDELLIIDERGLRNINHHIGVINKSVLRGSPENTILFCQNYYTSFIGSLIKKKHPEIYFHVNLKGVVPEEHLLYGESNAINNFLHYAVTRFFEWCLTKQADSFSVVSNQFQKYLVGKYSLDKEIIVFPSVFNQNIFYFDQPIREKTRKELEIHVSESLLTYSGSFQRWQNPGILFQLFSDVLATYPHYHLMIITYERDRAVELIQKYHLPEYRIHIKTGSPPEVNAWLNASDVCILLRKNDVVNQVSSPTKFLEYLVTKNKLFMTDHIGDYSEMIKNTPFGVVAPDLEPQTLWELFKQIDQLEYPTEEFIEKITKEYSIEYNINKIINVLS